MRIRIRENAASEYHRRCYRHARPDCGMLHNPEWEAMLEKVQGKWLEVETKYLFEDQFNTAPIPGVSDQGMRIMQESVAEIEGDVRLGKQRCNWCGKISNVGPTECPHCKNTGYCEPFLFQWYEFGREGFDAYSADPKGRPVPLRWIGDDPFTPSKVRFAVALSTIKYPKNHIITFEKSYHEFKGAFG